MVSRFVEKNAYRRRAGWKEKGGARRAEDGADTVDSPDGVRVPGCQGARMSECEGVRVRGCQGAKV